MNPWVSLAQFGPGWEAEARQAPYLHSIKPFSSPPLPDSFPPCPCTPCPCLMKEKGIDPSRESPELEAEFNLRKLFSYKWQAPGWPGLARALGDLCGPLSRPPPLLQAISKSTQPGGRGAGRAGQHSHRASCALVPILSHRSEVILSAPPGCLAFYVFVFFFSLKPRNVINRCSEKPSANAL